jgi:hypothetical protein
VIRGDDGCNVDASTAINTSRSPRDRFASWMAKSRRFTTTSVHIVMAKSRRAPRDRDFFRREVARARRR